MSDYAWIITEDLLAAAEGSFESEVGVIGPRGATPEAIAALRAGKGAVFSMGDDDGECYYRGRIVGTYDMTEPLDDFGTGNAGCTWISKGRGGQAQSIV